MALWHNRNAEDILGTFNVEKRSGLTAQQANEALTRTGPNELVQGTSRSVWSMLASQFTNVLVVILIAAAIASIALGDAKDAIAIFAIVLLNAILGFKQEYGAEQAMAALRRMSAPTVRVRRDGEVIEIESAQLVPGDILLIEAGNVIPADARLIECASLKVQEAALTGEAEAVEKNDTTLADDDLPLGDRLNIIYMGTTAVYGRAEAIVVETGMNTELGKVAGLLHETEDEPTPLSRKIAVLGHRLILLAAALIGIVVIIGISQGQPWKTVFMTAVSMAVAAVPEGLPAVVTITLALGARRMLARRALIRNLPAVETLGSVTTICTDKTGTLTQNVMTVVSLSLPDKEHTFSASQTESIEIAPASHPRELLSLAAASLCSDAILQLSEDGLADKSLGDPTETALVVAANRAGLTQPALQSAFPRSAEVPFDSERKRMTTLHTIEAATDTPSSISALQELCAKDGSQAVAFAKGALDSILEICNTVYLDGRVVELVDEQRQGLKSSMEQMAREGIRVLAIAFRPIKEIPESTSQQNLEQQMTYLGLTGMRDPLREDVRDAVKIVREAGIRPVVITGDHPLMAGHIARELSLPGSDKYLTGKDVEEMNEEQLIKAVRECSLFARVAPHHKLRIVDALQAGGDIASMTGDGVNDAPALKSADIGVAMGITGTDVAKEAADMVLLDDRYATIVSAVREGRVIFDNIRRFVRYILASNSGELLVMLLGPLFGMPLPLQPVQILWMNLVTDGFPALALGLEGPEPDIMQRPPRDPKAPILDRRMAVGVVLIGLAIAALSIMAGRWYGAPQGVIPSSHSEATAERWQTMLFCTMVFAQLALAIGMRSRIKPIWRMGLLSNRAMLIAITATFLLQLGVIYIPFMQEFFHTVALNMTELGICVAAGAAILLVTEIPKVFRSFRKPVEG